MIPASKEQFQLSTDLARRRQRVLDADDTHCFSERERMLGDTEPLWGQMAQPDRYCGALEVLLSSLSVPVSEEDVILGRMVEGEVPSVLKQIAGGGVSHPSSPFGVTGQMQGHMTPDYECLVRQGLAGLVPRNTARGDACFSNTEQYAIRCVRAISGIAQRYAIAAEGLADRSASPRREHLARAACALRHVPEHPARSFFEALQSIWFMHWIFSCVVGGRDFAFGRLDQILFPFYERDRINGVIDRREGVELLAHFFLKTNEIAGTASVWHKSKPVPCSAAKQYALLGGSSPEGGDAHNAVSLMFLDAARALRLPQPDLFIRYTRDAAEDWTDAVIESIVALGGQVQLVNESMMLSGLMQAGLRRRDAEAFTLSGCCRPDLPGCRAAEHYHNAVAWLVEAMGYGQRIGSKADRRFTSMRELLLALGDIARREIESAADARRTHSGPRFNLEDIVRSPSNGDMASASANGPPELACHFFGGIATIADSLYAVDRLVFVEKRLTLSEFRAILESDFQEHRALRREILAFPKFGNDNGEVDALASEAGNALLDGMASSSPGQVRYGGFFSLINHAAYGSNLPATPDGRLAGEPISENQSPGIGNDRSGPTALLKSVSKLPFHRAPAGGLNIRLCPGASVRQLRGLVEGFFAEGGLHLGITLVDSATWILGKGVRRACPRRRRGPCTRP